MWTKIDDYHLKHTSGATIAKIKVGDKTFYELWIGNKQYTPFASAQLAMDEYDAIEAEKRIEIISRNGATADHYE